MQRAVSYSLIGIIIVALFAAAPAFADDKTKHRDKNYETDVDHDEALALLKRSENKPLIDIRAAAVNAVPGDIVRVRVKRRFDRIVYEFKIITQAGRLREVYVDPTTLEVLKVE